MCLIGNITRTIIQKWNQYQAAKLLYVTSVLSRKKTRWWKTQITQHHFDLPESSKSLPIQTKSLTCRHKFPMFPSAPCDVTRSLQSSSPEPVRLMRAIWNRTTTLWLKMCNREYNYINKIRRIL